MVYIRNYRKRVSLGANSFKDYIANEMENNFLDLLQTSPSSKLVPMTDPEEINVTDKTKKVLCIINELSNNDQKALDEKQMLVTRDTNVDVGCYIIFDNCYWLVIFKEHKVIDTYKKFIIRRCNQIVNYKYQGVVYSIPVSIENLTMYSDGLSDVRYTSMADAKRMVSYGSNPITRTMALNTRIMLTHKTVFRMTHFNDFEYNGVYTGAEGLIKTLVLQTTLVDEDDLENNIAWNEVARETPIIEDKKIVGDDKIMLGSKKVYKVQGFDDTNDWLIESVDNSNYQEFLNITINNDKELIVTAKTNVIYVGYTFNIKLIDVSTQDVLDTKKVTIKGFL